MPDDGVTLLGADYSYYANGQLHRVDYLNGASVEYVYDDAGKIELIRHRKDHTGYYLLRMAYIYDPDDARGLPIRTEEWVGPASSPTFMARTEFEYDGLGRLRHESREKPWVALAYSLEYTYDAGGNRLTKVDENNEVETVYHYDIEDQTQYEYESANNRLMYFETFDTSGGGYELVSTTYYYYNDYGNVTRKVTELADPEPEEKRYQSTYLKYAKNGQAVTYIVGEEWNYLESWLADYAVTFAREFWYDGARQRILNREYDPVEMTDGRMVEISETWSDYVGDSVYADFEIVPEEKGYTYAVPRIYEPGIGKVEHPLDGPNRKRAYYHADRIGTTRLLSGGGGDAEEESVYSAFGGLVSGTNHRYGYAGAHGYQSHAQTPFLHLGARYYDPDTGRFLQRDPIGIKDAYNVYEYVKSKPAVSVDPEGLWDDPAGPWPMCGFGGPCPTDPDAPAPDYPGFFLACTGGEKSWLDDPRTVSTVQWSVDVVTTPLLWEVKIAQGLKYALRLAWGIATAEKGAELLSE